MHNHKQGFEPTLKDLRFYIANDDGGFLAAVTRQEDARGVGYAAPEWTCDPPERLNFVSQQEAIRIASFVGHGCRVESTPKRVLIA
ncbi:hypothetical protein [Lacticaseibacillus jixiensis]|uniref:hypothetical protein n=1 Tax=Lacticaseibacillus jixiensis TaxID=3231926 RepID=UPI0036F26267